MLLASLGHGAGSRADEATGAASDPPDSVGRIAVLSGSVLFQAQPTSVQAAALPNYPLSLGNVVETAPAAAATIDIAAGRFYLDGRTRLRIGALSDGSSAVALEQGALVLHVLRGGDGQVFTVETPKGTLRVDQSGYYEVVADPAGSTSVSAVEGVGQFRTADRGELVLHRGERMVLAEGEPQRGAAVEDDLIRRTAAEIEAIGENTAEAPEHVSTEITGFQDLARYGVWELTNDYGPIWRPQVGSDWSPYSLGQWVDVAPWGNTWIDAAPWGFAPFHYGRWLKLNRRWAWLPGESAAPPVYAPALVSFFDTPKEQGGARRWIALGPEEPYLPPYPVSIVYFRQINAPTLPAVVKVTQITNIVQITNVVQIVERRPVLILNRLVNRPGAPPPKPRSRRPTASLILSQPGPLPPEFQSGLVFRPIVTPPQVRKGAGAAVNAAPSPSVGVAAPQPVTVAAPAQPPAIVIPTMPVPAVSAPVVVTRTLPAGNNVTMGTGAPLGTQATAPSRPTVTFGQSPGPNSVTFP
jgi:hypothetical protein